MEIIVNKPGAQLARKDNMNLMPINIALVCQCPNVGKLLSEKMFSQGVGTQLIRLETFDWKSMYCSPVVDRRSSYYKVEEPDLLTREYLRRKRNEAEWQAVRGQYPEHLWGLVTREDAAAFKSPPSPPRPLQQESYSDYMDGVDYDGSPRYVRPTAPQYPIPSQYHPAPANYNAPGYPIPGQHHPAPANYDAPQYTYAPQYNSAPGETSSRSARPSRDSHGRSGW